jgi:hypothetical protein
MMNENLAAGTIASRISGLKWFCETRGRPHDLNAQIVSRVMGAARRCNSRVADKAKPVTPENLRTFRIICNHPGLPSWYVLHVPRLHRTRYGRTPAGFKGFGPIRKDCWSLGL